MEPHEKWVTTGELPPEPSTYLNLADKLAQAVIKKLVAQDQREANVATKEGD